MRRERCNPLFALRRSWERKFRQPSEGNPLFEDVQAEVHQSTLLGDLDDAEFEQAIAMKPKNDDRRLVPYPHADVDDFLAEVADVYELRRTANVLP